MRNGIDQLDNITKLLEWKPTSKRAVIQFFNAEDIALDYSAARSDGFIYPEVPCTVSLQFHLREGLLHLSANMRSNDAYKGLPHDVFCFTMIQEMMARRLRVEPGEYLHYAGSMHIYDTDLDEIRGYISEGHQKMVEMPAMPLGDPFSLAEALVTAEGRIRAGEALLASVTVPWCGYRRGKRALTHFRCRRVDGSRLQPPEILPCPAAFISVLSFRPALSSITSRWGRV